MDLDHWLTDKEAGNLLRVSARSVRRYAEQGKVEVQYRQRAGRRSEAVYNPADVQKLMPAAHVLPPEPEEDADTRVATFARMAAAYESLNYALAKMATAITERRELPAPEPPSKRKLKPEVPIEAKVWLTLTEAVAFSGLPRRELREYLRTGVFAAKMFGRRWRVLRSSIERGSIG